MDATPAPTVVSADAGTITEHEASQVARANATGLQPVVFVHGLWLLPSSWDRWVALFEDAGCVALTPGWPDDPDTVEEANANPEVFAHKSVGQVADHVDEIIRGLNKKPVIIGHSFGGLLVQILAGRGRASATVAIDPGPFRGVLPLPFSALKSAWPVIGNPANRKRAIPLTYEQFRFGFANAVSENEARELYETFAVPASGIPLFQAATANLNPWTEAKVDTDNPERGPVLIISPPVWTSTTLACRRCTQLIFQDYPQRTSTQLALISSATRQKLMPKRLNARAAKCATHAIST